MTLDAPTAASDVWNTPATFVELVRRVMGGIEPGRLVPLTHGLFAVVDEEDFERVNARGWFACPTSPGRVYARSSSMNPSRVYMHRFIVDAPDGVQVDHRNHCTLDNRRKNLRICTRKQNARNSSKSLGTSSRYKGVSRHEGQWRAIITVDGCRIWLGRYRTELEAARAYDAAARHHFGEFAAPNFPERAA